VGSPGTPKFTERSSLRQATEHLRLPPADTLYQPVPRPVDRRYFHGGSYGTEPVIGPVTPSSGAIRASHAGGMPAGHAPSGGIHSQSNGFGQLGSFDFGPGNKGPRLEPIHRRDGPRNSCRRTRTPVGGPGYAGRRLVTAPAAESVRPGGLEPPTWRVEAACSVQLSYEREPYCPRGPLPVAWDMSAGPTSPITLP
jgi:hypothetical protein